MELPCRAGHNSRAESGISTLSGRRPAPCSFAVNLERRIKEEALSKTTPINTKAGRYQPDDDLLAFLKGL
jgi:hypothetical protein